MATAIFRALIILLLGLTFTAYGAPRVPLSNTAEYNALHGIVNDGKTANTIVLHNDRNDNRPKLRIPAGFYVTAYTSGSHSRPPTPIKKGYADHIVLSAYFHPQTGLGPTANQGSAPVQINLIASLDPYRESEKARKSEESARKIAELKAKYHVTKYVPEPTLLELRAPPSLYRSQVYLVPVDPLARTPEGEHHLFGCNGESEVSRLFNRCAARFNLPNGLAGSFVFRGEQIPHWAAITAAVRQLVTSIVVQ